MSKKYFTIDEADLLLPYVREELSFLQETKRRFTRMYQELQQIKKQQPSDEHAIFTMECQLEFMELEAQMHIRQLMDKGIQVKDIDIGLFDFPALIDGEEVLLCWKAGEPRITHYHGLTDGFSGRKPLE
ncbi:DUF2203 domain-containing protein [Brevibacillus composti]|uniref:DUF2203 domain-containing protein n=1 Tax=Brevibacillus composti TaxID=2796470 RepID=A0A7T5JM40_9BACL|nr:DUF2203 domain-containing protein [Brevibacillus composti]QQE72704.1 DUF2203 domain-containing protein [Brevibacillus composti]QUO39782.1 DUF2203 domain-containing protein [Brevibacillus composti]